MGWLVSLHSGDAKRTSVFDFYTNETPAKPRLVVTRQGVGEWSRAGEDDAADSPPGARFGPSSRQAPLGLGGSGAFGQSRERAPKDQQSRAGSCSAAIATMPKASGNRRAPGKRLAFSASASPSIPSAATRQPAAGKCPTGPRPMPCAPPATTANLPCADSCSGGQLSPETTRNGGLGKPPSHPRTAQEMRSLPEELRKSCSPPRRASHRNRWHAMCIWVSDGLGASCPVGAQPTNESGWRGRNSTPSLAKDGCSKTYPVKTKVAKTNDSEGLLAKSQNSSRRSLEPGRPPPYIACYR